MAKPERFTLDHEGQPGVDGADPRALVFAEEASALGGIRGVVKAPPEECRVREGRLEALAAAADRGRLFLRISALIRRCDS
jgi:hypothetical protein